MEKDIELTISDLEAIAGGEYDGPIPYSEIDNKAWELDWIRSQYGLENACCVASRYYWDDAATEVFRTQGGFMWGQYVKAHYDPRAGLDR